MYSKIRDKGRKGGNKLPQLLGEGDENMEKEKRSWKLYCLITTKGGSSLKIRREP